MLCLVVSVLITQQMKKESIFMKAIEKLIGSNVSKTE